MLVPNLLPTDRIEHLFDAIRNPTTGEPYTNAEVARMTLGDLSEEDVEGIRTGAISDPTVGQIAALAAVFGVVPSYPVDRDRDPSVLDEETLEALADETARQTEGERPSAGEGEADRPRDRAGVRGGTLGAGRIDPARQKIVNLGDALPTRDGYATPAS